MCRRDRRELASWSFQSYCAQRVHIALIRIQFELRRLKSRESRAMTGRPISTSPFCVLRVCEWSFCHPGSDPSVPTRPSFTWYTFWLLNELPLQILFFSRWIFKKHHKSEEIVLEKKVLFPHILLYPKQVFLVTYGQSVINHGFQRSLCGVLSKFDFWGIRSDKPWLIPPTKSLLTYPLLFISIINNRKRNQTWMLN